jgi:RND family efflux transporter MFP subunit
MQTQAGLQNAKAAYERASRLFEQKFISQAALDRAQADYKVALAQAAASEAAAGQARLVHGYTAVVAPYSGIVAARLVEVGEMVMPGRPLMTTFEPGEMRVVVSVPQQELAKFGLNPEAMVEISSGGYWIKAASVTVLPVADARTHSTQLRVHLPADEKYIYPGMFVRAHFVMGKASRLVIPASAVLRRSEVVAVYVADGKGGVKLRQIRLGGMPVDGLVEVLSGLSQGEQVALDPVKAGIISTDGGKK